MSVQLDFIRPSSIGTWLMCQLKWKYSIIDKYPRGQSGAALVGTAVHAGIEANLVQKLESKKDISVDIATEAALDAFAVKENKVKWGNEPKDAEALRQQIEAIMDMYIKVHAPLVQPLHIEKQIDFEFMGVRIKGRLDLIDDNHTLIDHKTSKNKPSSIGVGYQLQATLYKLGAEAENIRVDKIRVDYIVKTKKPYMRPLEVENYNTKTIGQIVTGISQCCELEMFQPNPDGWWCSEKWCDFHPANKGPCPYGM